MCSAILTTTVAHRIYASSPIPRFLEETAWEEPENKPENEPRNELEPENKPENEPRNELELENEPGNEPRNEPEFENEPGNEPGNEPENILGMRLLSWPLSTTSGLQNILCHCQSFA